MRPVTLFVGAWADLGLEKFAETAARIGYQGVELSFRQGIVDMDRALSDSAYRDSFRELLGRHNLFCDSISAAQIGKMVAETYDPVFDSRIPPACRGKPDEVRRWAVDAMTAAPAAARMLGCRMVHAFLGSPIWRYVYPYPRRPESMVEEAFAFVAELWKPILDEFERQGVALAFEVHPGEIAYDYYTTERLFAALDHHPAFKLNFDPSHLVWQGVDPVLFLRDFRRSVVHVHIKDVQVRLDGRASILSSHLDFGDRRRGWDFRSPGHGQVPFEEIVRELNAIGYDGPISVEWEDNGMDRMEGAVDALRFVQRLNFSPSGIEFDRCQGLSTGGRANGTADVESAAKAGGTGCCRSLTR